MSESLEVIAKRIEAKPWNRPGTDKTWVLNAMSTYLQLREEIRRARRVPNREWLCACAGCAGGGGRRVRRRWRGWNQFLRADTRGRFRDARYRCAAGADVGERRLRHSVRTIECYGTDMSKRLTRSGNSLALVIDRPLLEALEIDAETELELSTDGDVLVVTPVRDRKRKKRTADLVAEAHEQYGGVFRRLAE